MQHVQCQWKPTLKDSPGQHGSSSEHHGSAGKSSPHRTMVENRGISSSCYPLLINIFLFYLLSFSNTDFKNTFSSAPPFKPAILSATKRVTFFNSSETLSLKYQLPWKHFLSLASLTGVKLLQLVFLSKRWKPEISGTSKAVFVAFSIWIVICNFDLGLSKITKSLVFFDIARS